MYCGAKRVMRYDLCPCGHRVRLQIPRMSKHRIVYQRPDLSVTSSDNDLYRSLRG